MAVAIEMDFKGATLEQYDEVMKLMGFDDGPDFASRRDVPLGGRDDRRRHPRRRRLGDQGAFDKFAAEQIGPFTAQAGIPARRR